MLLKMIQYSRANHSAGVVMMGDHLGGFRENFHSFDSLTITMFLFLPTSKSDWGYFFKIQSLTSTKIGHHPKVATAFQSGSCSDAKSLIGTLAPVPLTLW
jgi:hypothetical protein